MCCGASSVSVIKLAAESLLVWSSFKFMHKITFGNYGAPKKPHHLFSVPRVPMCWCWDGTLHTLWGVPLWLYQWHLTLPVANVLPQLWMWWLVSAHADGLVLVLPMMSRLFRDWFTLWPWFWLRYEIVRSFILSSGPFPLRATFLLQTLPPGLEWDSFSVLEFHASEFTMYYI